MYERFLSQNMECKRQVADFALITFVQSLNLTDNQRHELISLLDDKYRVSSIMAIAAGNLSI